ncbi:MAG: helix-turn-helix transcriptional regulator [Clostridia bacterium]|nr:helix-turn-helix transcriptional regulator [Clostridia bacterium]
MKNSPVVLVKLGNLVIKVLLRDFPGSGVKAGDMIHSHAMYELHILYSGCAEIEAEGRSVVLYQNDCALVYPDTFHNFKRQDEDSTIVSLGFFIEKDDKKLDTDYYETLLQHFCQAGGILVLKNNESVTEYIQKMIAGRFSQNPFSQNMEEALLVLIFSELLCQIFGGNAPVKRDEQELAENDQRAYIIEDYFNHYYMEDISLKKLSALLCLGEKQTNRMIQKAFGENFRERLSKIRLKAAEKLLTESDLDVKNIAETVGYQSYNGFYLAFKSKTGLTPLEYREKKKKGRE